MIFLGKRDTEIQQRQAESEQLLRTFMFLDLRDLYHHFSVPESGLDSRQAAQRQETYGKNMITTDQNNTALHCLLASVINPFNIVLLVIAVMVLFTDVVYSQYPDYVTISTILLPVAVSSLVAFIQGERSNLATGKLSSMISNKADVLQDGRQVEIPMEDIIPEDIVRLSAGSMLLADIRFLWAKSAFVAQGSLIGESNPVEKYTRIPSAREDALTDLQDTGFIGNNMVGGSAIGMMLATGNGTYFGSIAKSLSGDRAKNSFEWDMDSINSLLTHLMLVIIPIVLLISDLTKGDWGDALLFSTTIAVGLTPEMLLVIMTSALAKGAVFMSKCQVVIKTLGAIQTFGGMDVPCTNKIGTLTEDRIISGKYINTSGDEDSRILRHAFLDSYFQTGLKNLLNLAIINRTHENGTDPILQNYLRLDEIPFDFSRRRMSVLLQDRQDKQQLVTKGAVEEILSICSYMEWNGELSNLDWEILQKVRAVCERHNRDGLRIIAVAQKNSVPAVELRVEDGRDMVLIGLIGSLDPPKKNTRAAVTALSSHGVHTIVLTGDNEDAAVKICGKVGVDVSHYLTGRGVGAMGSAALSEAVEKCSLFAKLFPSQKARAIQAIQANGHAMGHMSDEISDAPPLHQAGVSVSMDTTVDVAEGTANIILLKKDLMVLEEGMVTGRRTFGNIVKCIKMAASGNFGSIISMIIVSLFLPFLSVLPVQILTRNLLCDLSQMGIPFDHVDQDYLLKPREQETRSIKSFMAFVELLSSVFDILCFAVMWKIMGADTMQQTPLFRYGQFVFGAVPQVLAIHMIRSGKIPFMRSLAAKPLLMSTTMVAFSALLIGFSPSASGPDMAALPFRFLPWLILLLVGYCISTQLRKQLYIRHFGEWL